MEDDSLVIETNVTIVANGKSDHASIECELSCLDVLEKCAQLSLVLDESGLIMEEYSRHLSHAGSPGVGDMFFKYLHDHQYSDDNIKLVTIRPSSNSQKSFDELPENSLDVSDRKFLATAVVAQASIVNATDSDWTENQDLLDGLGVTIHQLCPQHASKVLS